MQFGHEEVALVPELDVLTAELLDESASFAQEMRVRVKNVSCERVFNLPSLLIKSSKFLERICLLENSLAQHFLQIRFLC